MHKLKPRWDNIITFLFILFIIASVLDIIISKPVTHSVTAGQYECKGHILKVCYGPEDVYHSIAE